MPDNSLRKLVRANLIETMSSIQRDAKRPVPQITDDTVPFDHLPGFDSLCGVETAILFSERVSVEIDEISFVSPKTARSMAVRDIVELIIQKNGALIAAKMESNSMAAPSSSSPSSVA